MNYWPVDARLQWTPRQDHPLRGDSLGQSWPWAGLHLQTITHFQFSSWKCLGVCPTLYWAHADCQALEKEVGKNIEADCEGTMTPFTTRPPQYNVKHFYFILVCGPCFNPLPGVLNLKPRLWLQDPLARTCYYMVVHGPETDWIYLF